MNIPSSTPDRYDVVVLGGSMAGGAVATLLLRDNPALRVLIIEKSPVFTRRVGEATVEVSAYFLGRMLGLTQHLNHEHLAKQGLRFWFANDQATAFDQCSEIGGRYLVRVPSYQLDRAVIDEEILRRAAKLGAEVWRPARVTSVELHAGGEQVVTVDRREAEVDRVVRARWVVDATGVAAFLARKQGWWRPNNAHPTASAWARWRGVKDWDDAELARKYPDYAQAIYGVRGTATNHLMGDGWWAWWIPLRNGDISIGAVIDQRLVQWPEGGHLGDRLKQFLMQHPVARELMGDAEWIEGDVHWRKNLAYSTTTFAGDGFALVGDAAGFMDPFYSPGMDWIAYTTYCASRLILAQQKGEDVAPKIDTHNRDFRLSYERWFEALYRDKYHYIGEYDLMQVAFLFDLGLYYLGVVAAPFKRGPVALTEPTLATRRALPAFYLMRGYNRRLARMAQSRRERGRLRRYPQGRYLIQGFTLDRGSGKVLWKALRAWLWLELTEGWRSWGRPTAHAAPAPSPVAAEEQPACPTAG